MKEFWQISVDTGGTFTDCIAVSPDRKREYLKVLSSGKVGGRILSQKDNNGLSISLNTRVSDGLFIGYQCQLPSLNWQSEILYNDAKGKFELKDPLPQGHNIKNSIVYLTAGEEAPLLITRLATQSNLAQDLTNVQLRLGTTKGTNALLENQGAETALIVTKGFKDLLKIGTQQRPNLFSLNIIKPRQLPKIVIEVEESISASGVVEIAISNGECQRCLELIKTSNCKSVAIAFKNSYQNPVNELHLAKLLYKASINDVTTSAALYPSINYLTRTETAVVNAYLSPVLSAYLNVISKTLGKEAVRIMTSSGALAKIENFNAKDSLLSGPAGGVIGAASVADQAGIDKVLTIDMGGTSSDVARYNSGFDYKSELIVGEAHIFTQALAIETVAAGGGSICQVDEGRMNVGPGSAGSMPGPACYGNNGPLTITDLNLLSGRIDETAFGVPLDKDAASLKLESVANSLINSKNANHDGLLLGFLSIANQKMADAIKKISITKGFDPKDYTLLGFGGAVGQHICDIAELLQIEKVIIPYNGSLLSAVGISKARIKKHEMKQILLPLSQKESIVNSINTLGRLALEKLKNEGIAQPKISAISIFARLYGQDSSIEIPYTRYENLADQFKKQYLDLFGHWVERDIEVESIKVTASEPDQFELSADFQPSKSSKIEAMGKRNILFDEGWSNTDSYAWPEFVQESKEFVGPLVFSNPFTSIIINPGWKVVVKNEHLIISSLKTNSKEQQKIDAVELALFTNRFKSVAERMGSLLQRTALSVNIKERLDFSCALLDKDARLVVNAPHIPVHLGSLGICTRSVIDVLDLKNGDIAITNHPAFGGSHLPDVTLIAPVFYDDNLIGYLANRAHHAEIGGKAPGSMPADANNLTEEGVVISPRILVSNGKAKWDELKKIMLSARYPTRNLDDNIADLQAAVASIIEGQKAMSEMLNTFGSKNVRYYMHKLSSLATTKLNQKLDKLNISQLNAIEHLDDGSTLKVNIERAEKLIISFAGTSGTNSNNLNATEAIVNGAVIYVLKILIDDDIPLNEGLMSDVALHIPKGSFLNPNFPDELDKCPAVVGGNTEVSQRLVDTLIKAFELASCSQGTMNNFLFGDDSFGYYETICGGTGAGPGFDGTDAVHQHMTNTKITDPEILEFRYPVKVNRFSIREESGGKGKWKGGNGVSREFKFNKPVIVTFLSQHRKVAPYGLLGGDSGALGEQYCTTKDNERVPLDGVGTYQIKAGETITILTPGGGGYQKK